MPSNAPTIGRNKKGRFVPGNAGGPGRPTQERERQWLQALREGVTVEDWKIVIQGALEDAKARDEKARSWLGKYLMDPALAQDFPQDNYRLIMQELVSAAFNGDSGGNGNRIPGNGKGRSAS